MVRSRAIEGCHILLRQTLRVRVFYLARVALAHSSESATEGTVALIGGEA